MGLEKAPEVVGVVMLTDHGLAVAVDVQIDQRHVDRRQLPRLAQQPGVDLGLGPVQLAVIVRLAGEVAAVGLDLFQPVACRVVAIGTAAHPQALVFTLQHHLRLIAGAALGHHPAVPGNTFLGTGRRREAQVEVADLGAEFAQGAHGHGVAHAGVACQRTWQTATGSPWTWQNSSQRSWLSCRRSPGALTSTMR